VIVVSDTSAINALLVIRRVHLLRDLFREVLIPPAVAVELRRSHAVIPDFIRERSVTDLDWVARLLVEVDRGEAEAIALARQVQADALLIDDKIGRRVAQQAGLPVVGLLGVLAEAKRAGLLTALDVVLDELVKEAGFYILSELRGKILKSAREH
jgi:hypothetical protein